MMVDRPTLSLISCVVIRFFQFFSYMLLTETLLIVIGGCKSSSAATKYDTRRLFTDRLQVNYNIILIIARDPNTELPPRCLNCKGP